MKGHEDIIVTQDLSIRNSMGNVIQWRYGDNGVSLTEIERLPLKFFGESKKSIKAKYEWSDDELKSSIGPRVYKQEIADKKVGPMTEQLCKNELTKLTNFYGLLHQRFYKYKAAFSDIIVYAPVDIERTITNYKMQFSKSEDHIEKDLGPRYIINEVDILCAELPKMFRFHRHSEFVATERERRNKSVEKFDPQEFNKSLDYFTSDQNAVLLFEIYLRSILSSKRLLTEYKVSKFIFEKVLDRIRVAFNKAVAPAGDMVGPIASQSIAEPVKLVWRVWNREILQVY
jgi:DNA-directed RNA polymerase II subunit RPB1